MKWLKLAFSALGFTFQYIIPLILFGGVIPYTHEGESAGFTKMGYIAIIAVLLIVGNKVKEFLIAQPKSIFRGVVLSLFPIAFWLVIQLALSWLVGFVGDIVNYWDRIILFIVIGRVFYITEEAMSAKESTNVKN